MEIIIYKKESEWNANNPGEKDFKDWENVNELTLPQDYKHFLSKYDGGRIYPLIFKHNFPENELDLFDEALFLDPLYRWTYVCELWSDKTINWTKPKGTLMIGGDPGRVEVIMSLKPKSFGNIYACIYAVGENEDGPSIHTSLLANNFTEFIYEKLYENSEKEGYDHWYIPDTKNNARKLEF